MIIAQVVRSKVPPTGYGGTERDVYWLSRALAEMGHRVYLVARPGSRPVGAELIGIPHRITRLSDILKVIPSEVDIIHFHYPIEAEPKAPYLITVHGNMGRQEQVLPSTVFLSRDHARRHRSRHFVYNGLDLSEYGDRGGKEDYFLFLAKFLSRKGLDTAICLAKELSFPLIAAGGRRISFRKSIRYVGEVDGEEKRTLLARARALLLPVRWPEPLGLVAIEALASGTPVIASRLGGLREIVSSEVGFLCDTYEEFVEAVRNIDRVNPEDCRKRAAECFSAEVMARNYLKYFERILEKGGLGDEPLVEGYK